LAQFDSVEVILWNVLGTGIFGGTPVTFDDLQATNYPQQFYLIQSP
jgi:hypothetical protein